jgi:hypothetical protein
MKLSVKYCLAVSILLISTVAVAQKKYEKVAEKEGVQFYAKLKPSRFMKKDSPLKLMLKAYNSNEYPVSCEMNVSFFENGLLNQESDAISFCLKSKKSIKGKKNGMQLLNDGSSNEEIMDPAAVFEIYETKITKVENCN